MFTPHQNKLNFIQAYVNMQRQYMDKLSQHRDQYHEQLHALAHQSLDSSIKELEDIHYKLSSDESGYKSDIVAATLKTFIDNHRHLKNGLNLHKDRTDTHRQHLRRLAMGAMAAFGLMSTADAVLLRSTVVVPSQPTAVEQRAVPAASTVKARQDVHEAANRLKDMFITSLTANNVEELELCYIKLVKALEYRSPEEQKILNDARLEAIRSVKAAYLAKLRNDELNELRSDPLDILSEVVNALMPYKDNDHFAARALNVAFADLSHIDPINAYAIAYKSFNTDKKWGVSLLAQTIAEAKGLPEHAVAAAQKIFSVNEPLGLTILVNLQQTGNQGAIVELQTIALKRGTTVEKLIARAKEDLNSSN